MAMCPGGGLLMLGSSVYRRRGYMFRQYRELHGNDLSPDSICWFSPSAVMNPVLPAHVIERALQENAPKARAEFFNIWREDLSERDHLAACGAPVGGMPRASSTIGGIPVSGWPMSFGRRWW